MKKYGSPEKAWKNMDVNKSGTISCSEFIGQCKLGHLSVNSLTTPGQGDFARKVFSLLNREEKDGVINWSEFVGAKLPSAIGWVTEAEKANIKDAKKPAKLPKAEAVVLTKEEKIKIELEKFQDWCVSTFDNPATVFKHFDVNGNGDISCAEFVQRCGARRRGKPDCPGAKDTWKAMFYSLDDNRNGVIGKKELYDPLKDKFAAKRGASREGRSEEGSGAPKKLPKVQKTPKQTKASQEGKPVVLRGAEALLHDVNSYLCETCRRRLNAILPVIGECGLCGAKKPSQSQSSWGSSALDKELRMNIISSREAVKDTAKQLAAVTDAGAEVRRCVKAMQAQHRALWTVLTGCETELDRMEARPQKQLDEWEQVQNSFQKALEDEWEVTFNAREDLVEKMAKGEKVISALERVRQELTAFLCSKRQAERAERSKMMKLLTPRGPRGIGNWSFANTTDGPWSASQGQHGSEDNQQTIKIQGQNDQMDEKKLLARADHLEGVARKLCAAGDASIMQGKDACKQAATQTESYCDRRRLKENEVKENEEPKPCPGAPGRPSAKQKGRLRT